MLWFKIVSERRARSRMALAAAVTGAMLASANQALALVAFPGAQGAGANALGGRGGDVYHVTSLADTNTAGTLRYGISQASGARTIVFDVSGTIALTANLNVNKSNITIAGQTAPGDGICVKNYTLEVSGSNVVMRYMRSRLGIDASQESDAVGVTGGSNNILDHISAGWSVDETLSATDTASSLTVQYSSIAQALRNSIHTKGSHGYGSLLKPDVNATFSFLHNLYADNDSRNPRPGAYNGMLLQLDFRNNVVANWGGRAGYSGDNTEFVNMNYVGNYLIAGPPSSNVGSAFLGGGTTTQIYQSGNKIDSVKTANSPINGTDTGWGMFTGTYTQSASEFALPAATTLTADAALADVLANVGANAWRRDRVDVNVINQVKTKTGAMVDTVEQAGGYPVYNSVPAFRDSDGDGMTDAWEIGHGLNKNLASDRNILDAQGYTMLEGYLNSLAVTHTPQYFKSVTADWSTASQWGNGVSPGVNDDAIIGQPGASGIANVTTAVSSYRLFIGDTGGNGAGKVWVKSGGSLAIGNWAVVGDRDNGTLQIDAGAVTAAGVQLGNTGFTGALVMNGGTLTSGYFSSGAGVANVTINGGALSLQPASGDTTIGDIGSSALPIASLTMSGSGAINNVRDIWVASLAGTGGSITNLTGTLNVNTSATTTFAGTVGGAGKLAKAGVGSLTLAGANAFTGGATVNTGALVIGNAAALGTGKLTVNNSAIADTTPSLPVAVKLPGGLSINSASGAKLDVRNNALVISGTTLAAVQALITSGYAGGAWNGGGIMSSDAAGDAAHLTTLGVIKNDNGAGGAIYGSGTIYGLFEGQNAGINDVLVKYTWFGDTDLNGKVTGGDYAKIDNGFNAHLTGWNNGDFNNDGVVNGADYSLIDNAYNSQGVVLIAQSTAMVAGAATVPEPSSVFAALAGILILSWRRRRRGNPDAE